MTHELKIIFTTILIALLSFAYYRRATQESSTSNKDGESIFSAVEPPLPSGITWPILSKVVAEGRLISIPDVHGDYDGLVKVLRHLKIISDHDTNWVGGNAVIVQTGDLLDRGPKEVEILRLLGKLKIQAQKQGGEVVLIMGNHELLNIMGEFLYAHPLGTKGFEPAGRRFAFEIPNGEFAQFVRSFSAACVVKRKANSQEGTILFSHAGVFPEFFAGPNPIETLNSKLYDLVKSEMKIVRSLYHADPILGNQGPLWNRILSLSPKEGFVCEKVLQTLEITNAGKMVVGHTPQFGQPRTRCGGKLVLADVGFSQGYFGHYLALEHFEDGSYQIMEPLGRPDPSVYQNFRYPYVE